MNDESSPEPWFSTQQQLMEDERGTERDALLEKLADSMRAIKRQMDAGVTPSEFATLNKVRQGLEAATEVVTKVWRAYHPT
ncbi:MAG TPA: EscE/YscE/SsaE family type III secretion system needle protein co-chaperone [Candidatus Competibacteraceae bacterium]|nr:EscE/YscE/SsaE family type III secretion system needle protein co-chaperone [Candidatus Competibacteraceae bacterium]HQA24766.1 EscE/YscE/SsaE family type III secretion system needle protein co-chaperone [Candidatus Competibacteraceae bacterium]HQD55480.1 EscE/YscE/SsaE family type III secretion system needle protein co-chaperone [Candidatus Competibacteraceae bacterium]